MLQQPRAVSIAEAHTQRGHHRRRARRALGWQENYRKLVFFLRRDVRWHDGKPFSSKDVKYTFDLLRETPDAPTKLRLDPRREWYGNVEAVDALDPRRSCPTEAPATIPLADAGLRIHADLRRACAGGRLPHRLRGHGTVQGQGVAQGRVRRVREEPDYFVKNRPYLDGLRYLIIRGARHRDGGAPDGARGRGVPWETSKPIADQLKTAARNS